MKRIAATPAQSGQSIVLVAILSFVFIGMLALTLDGGNAFWQRRQAQNSADAGALAGARELCITGDANAAVSRAREYSITRNGASSADIFAGGGYVTVTAHIPFQTFFGGILGKPTMTASATAQAGCFAPGGGESVLPVAYSCADGVMADQNGNRYCDVIDYDVPYIIMNSRAVDEDMTCISQGGTVDCDVDNDGNDDLLIGGNRSWLDLSGSGSDAGNGSGELCSWIRSGFPHEIDIHTWFAGQPGVSNNVFQCVYDIIGKKNLLPVYDAISEGSPPNPYDDPSDTIIWSNGSSTTYFHVISFAIFIPTCVHATGGDRNCSLYNQFADSGVLGPDDKTIEGYFYKGFVTGLSGRPQDGVFTGAWTLYLTR